MEGLIDLGFNLPVLLAQVVNVGLLFVLLYLFAYKPVMRMLDERSRRIKESLAQADSVREQAAQAETEVKKQLEAASRDGQEKIARAVQIGEEVKQKAQLEARQEAEALITRARSEIHRERDEAIDEVRKEVADLTILAAEKVIDQSLDKPAHRRLIDKVLAESEALKKE
ncbi:MAG: F0F1 ATP synthase subunit B [Dehalococcoidales bacterium]